MIDKTAIVSLKAQIGNNVTIGPFSIIYDNVEIGDNTEIASYCEIGVPSELSNQKKLRIGENSIIRSHSVFYESSTFGNKLITGHRVTVREHTNAGENLQIGTLTDIQGDCNIGNFVRLHSNVHIGKMSQISDFVWIYPYCVLTNDPHPPSETLKGVCINRFAVIATMSVILPGVVIGEGALIGAHSMVNKNAEANMIYSGNPATKIGPTSRIKLSDGSRKAAYPWINHFMRGYPKEVLNQWKLI